MLSLTVSEERAIRGDHPNQQTAGESEHEMATITAPSAFVLLLKYANDTGRIQTPAGLGLVDTWIEDPTYFGDEWMRLRDGLEDRTEAEIRTDSEESLSDQWQFLNIVRYADELYSSEVVNPEGFGEYMSPLSTDMVDADVFDVRC